MARKSIVVEPDKPHRLSLAELAAHDDACSDAMIDNAYFKSQIRKNRTKYGPLRGIKEDQVPQILLHKVIVAKDPTAAEKEIMQIPGVKRYRSSLRNRPERVNFRSHLQKYIAMYMTDCPWEVSTTNRYTITTYEAAVTARQRIKQGQVIKYLTGTLVPLTTAESADLDLTNRNFSIVVSSRKKNSSIFLGPARFANHDCDANGRLVTRGADGMEVMAVKNIEVGDEITVSYGDDYFGPGNIDCLCHTCERLIRNGWAASKEMEGSRATSVHSSQGLASPEPLRNKRKRGSELLFDDKPTKLARLKPSPSKLHQSWTPPISTDLDLAEDNPVAQGEPDKAEQNDVEQLSHGPELSPPSSPQHDASPTKPSVTADWKPPPLSAEQIVEDPKLNPTTARLLGNLPVVYPYPSPVSRTESALETDEADETDDPDTIVIKLESVETNKIEVDQADSLPSSDANITPVQTLTSLRTTESSRTMGRQVDDPVPSIEPAIAPVTEVVTSAKITVQTIPDCIRVPGDYLLTRKLLAQPHDRWVQCHNERCHSYFIQPNGYQTRRECPRCERHSMLYGFSWPKTDPDPRKIMERGGPGSGRGRGKSTGVRRSAYSRAGRSGKGSWVVGGGDEEERVMDHRTVHRFVLPEDERTTTRKGLLRMAEVARTRGDEIDVYERGHVGSAVRTESVGFDSDRSLTPDGEARRRSNRFVATKVYTDV